MTNEQNEIVDYKSFNYEWFLRLPNQSRPEGNQGTKKNKFLYKDIICAFDIETSPIDEIEQSVMYIWMFQFDTRYTVIGRTWMEFIQFRSRLASCMKDGQRLLIFVHNLSYEFQFLRGFYHFEPEEVFAISSRKVLKCNMHEYFEFRCSYLHSNMSLLAYTNKMGAEHKKLSGDEFNYKTRRYWYTELTPKQIQYCVHDVLGLVESIKIEMEYDGDNLYTFPLTSTGYVRRDAKQAMRKVSHTYVYNQLPDYDIYEMLNEAFRGGNTHANRFYAGVILHNVKSADRSSSYSDVLVNCKFPISRFFHKGACCFGELLDIINVRKKAVVMRIALFNVTLSNPYWGSPYLSTSKCRSIKNALYDNGRILSADYLETTITDIDLEIILSEYNFTELIPLDVAYARYGYLPKPLIITIIDYYVKKTSLKDIDGQELYYMKSKNKLNAIFGMMAQNPVKQSIDFIEIEEGVQAFIEQNQNETVLLNKHNFTAFLAYQWGVWCTAWARYRLEEGIRLAKDGYVYSDTDSVKYVGNIDWTSYNDQRISDSKESSAYATDKKGNIHYMGVYEQEPVMYEFCTLGSKKYCYREPPKNGLAVSLMGENGFRYKSLCPSKLSITVAGVNKQKGGKELEQQGGISAFKEGFKFIKAGGTESVYNDKPEIKEYTTEDGVKIHISSNVYIKDSTYTLGLTEEYKRLLEFTKLVIET